jgi:hypothetical protein
LEARVHVRADRADVGDLVQVIDAASGAIREITVIPRPWSRKRPTRHAVPLGASQRCP